MAQQDKKNANQAGYYPAQEPRNPSRSIAFIPSLIGGIIIALGGVAEALFGFMGGPYGYSFGHGGMMGGYYGGGYRGFGPGMMGGFYGGYGYGNYTQALIGLTFVGLAAGIIVLIVALYMGVRRISDARIMGTVIIVFSIIGLVTVGGVFLIGGVFGIIGGVLALVLK